MMRRHISLAQYALLPLKFETNDGVDSPQSSREDKGEDCADGFGTLQSASLYSADVDGDGNIELLVGGSSGCLAIFKHLQSTLPWATSPSCLGSIVTICSGFLTRPRSSASTSWPQIIVVSSEGDCHVFDLEGSSGGLGLLKPTATYRVVPSVSAAVVINTGREYDDIYIATTDKTLNCYGIYEQEIAVEHKIHDSAFNWVHSEKYYLASDNGFIRSLSILDVPTSTREISSRQEHVSALVAGLEDGNALTFWPLRRPLKNCRRSFSASLPKLRAAKIASLKKQQVQSYKQYMEIGMLGVTGVQDESLSSPKHPAYEKEEHSVRYIDGGHANGVEEDEDEDEDDEDQDSETPMSMMVQMQAEVQHRLQTQMRIQDSSRGGLSSLGEMAAMGFRGGLGGNLPPIRTYSKALSQPTASLSSAAVSQAAARAARGTDDRFSLLHNSDADAQRNAAESTKKDTGMTLLKSTVVLGSLSSWAKSASRAAESYRIIQGDSFGEDVAPPRASHSPFFAAATLEGDISIQNVSTGEIVWYDTLGSKRGQVFSLQALDITGDGIDELISCSWDGQTCIFDRDGNCVIYDFEDHVVAFRACQLSISSISHSKLKGSVGTFSGHQPCLVYATNDFISVFVMGSTTSLDMTKEDQTKEIHPSLALEPNHANIAESPRTGVAAGRSIKFVRPCSLSEILAQRKPDVVDSIMEIARDMSTRDHDVSFGEVVKHILKCRRDLLKE